MTAPRWVQDARDHVRLVGCDLDGAGPGEECDCPRHEVHMRRFARARHRNLIPPDLATGLLRYYLNRTGGAMTNLPQGRL
jgi:hypothetical protein